MAEVLLFTANDLAFTIDVTTENNCFRKEVALIFIFEGLNLDDQA